MTEIFLVCAILFLLIALIILDYRHVIDGPIIARNASDLYNLNNDYRDEDIVMPFETIFLPQSNLNVYEIINLVYILRNLVQI